MSVPVANPMMMQAAAAAAADDVVTKSLRFNRGDSPKLTRTFGTPTSQKKVTISWWMKLSEQGDGSTGYCGLIVSGNWYQDFSAINLGGSTNNKISSSSVTGGAYNSYKLLSRSLRDMGAWMHVCYVVDTTLSTAADRTKFYINGVRDVTFESSGETNWSLNHDTDWSESGKELGIGLDNATAGPYFGGYLAAIHYIDGQALTPSSFAEEDATTGQWKPKAYSGTGYGNNGFHLDFNEDSATSGSNAGIGKDVSGNGNYFNTTNLAASDVVLDNPSAGSNFCTLNPLDISRGTLSEGNTKYTATTSTWGNVRSTFAASTGKWYWEVTATTVSELQAWIAGILEANQPLTNDYWWVTGWNCYGVLDNNYKVTGSASSAFSNGIVSGSVIGFRLDLDHPTTTTLAISVNGVDKGTMFSILTDTEYSPALCIYGDGGAVGVADMNFGQGDPNGNNNYQDGNGKGNFKYEPPSGYLAWCTNTLTASIAKPAEHFNTLTYASSGAKTGVGFQPDLVWVKAREHAYDHELTDSVRGVTKALSSNDTGAESTDSTGLTAFGTDGFTVGAGTNYQTSAMVAWCWKAGTEFEAEDGVSDSGSKNVTAGFSIATWEGDDDGMGGGP